MSVGARVAHWVWSGSGASAAMARAVLSPASWLFGGIVSARNARFARGIGVQQSRLPTISVGNLTVGGTGKTPVAAWCARELQALGATPAIVLRGYGDDEWREHSLLSPGVPVVVDADRTRGIERAAGQGATVAVLDDAFQHRQAAREADLVLISADSWTDRVRLLPAGPFREPLVALQRASVAVITTKGALTTRIDAVRRAIGEVAPDLPVAVVQLMPGHVHAAAAGEALGVSTAPGFSLDVLAGRDVLAISAIGNPGSFEAALSASGARVIARRYADHHVFTAADVQSMLSALPVAGQAVCTRKDAVKLAPLWPRTAVPLWYLSQIIEVRHGADVLRATLSRVATANRDQTGASRPTAG